MIQLKRFLATIIAALLTACGEGGAPVDEGEAMDQRQAVATRSTDLGDGPTGARAAEPTGRAAPYLFAETWSGDLDVMRERGVIRLLTVYSIGNYFIEDGAEKGLVKDVARLLGREINEQFKPKHAGIQVAILPVARNELIPALLEGRGDIAIAGLTITPERASSIEFSVPASKPVSEILVTGPSAPAIGTIEDLAGETVFLRPSSSYRESLDALNDRFEAQGLPQVKIQPVSEYLEDEDLAEMVDNGTLPWLVVDDYKLSVWDGVFENLQPRADIVLRTGGRLGLGVSQGQSPACNAGQ